jgi:hypothetical protein
MDSLAPPLDLCIELRLALENGQSVFRAIKTVLHNGRNEMCVDLSCLLAHAERGENSARSDGQEKTSKNYERLYRKALLEVIEGGLKGEPILAQLKELESELLKICQSDIDRFVSTLPLKAMVPLMLVQFPAFLLVMLGPIVNELIKGFNS